MLYFESLNSNKNILILHEVALQFSMTAGQSCPAEVYWSLFNIEEERTQHQ
jgi:hypothetical protein